MELLGRGTFSQVFVSGEDENVVLKKYNSRNFKYLNELLIFFQVQNNKILNLYKYEFQSHSLPVIYLPRALCDLDDFLGSEKSKNDLIRFQLVSDILSAVEYLHRNKFIHGDIKSKNILIFMIGSIITIKLCDFNSCLFNPINKIHIDNVEYTTLWYRAPELLDSNGTFGREIDLWSVGCVIYEIFWTPCSFSSKRELFHACYDAKGLKLLYDQIQDNKLPINRAQHIKNNSFRVDIHHFIMRFLCFNPRRRITALDALNYVNLYLKQAPVVIYTPIFPDALNVDDDCFYEDIRKIALLCYHNEISFNVFFLSCHLFQLYRENRGTGRTGEPERNIPLRETGETDTFSENIPLRDILYSCFFVVCEHYNYEIFEFLVPNSDNSLEWVNKCKYCNFTNCCVNKYDCSDQYLKCKYCNIKGGIIFNPEYLAIWPRSYFNNISINDDFHQRIHSIIEKTRLNINVTTSLEYYYNTRKSMLFLDLDLMNKLTTEIYSMHQRKKDFISAIDDIGINVLIGYSLKYNKLHVKQQALLALFWAYYVCTPQESETVILKPRFYDNVLFVREETKNFDLTFLKLILPDWEYEKIFLPKYSRLEIPN